MAKDCSETRRRDVTLDAIGTTIRLERHRRGLTQAELARIAGVGKGRVEDVENGRGAGMGFGYVSAMLGALGFVLRVDSADGGDET